jgi:TPR repeat protein
MPSITVIEKKAKQGDANSQYLLGFLYDQGEQIPKDLSNALIWYKKAAAQGHAKAQFSLGRLYDLGEGIAEDNQEALKWYRKAAQQGDVSAQFSLGAAARQGDVDAQFLLARMYFEGEGVQQDYVKAYSWFHLSAASGNTMAADHQNQVGRIMTKEQRAEGQQLSKQLIISK